MENKNRNFKRICIYCGSADGLRPEFYEAAYQMGKLLAEKQIEIVYGAGKTGLMGAVADGALEVGGTVIGIVPTDMNQPHLIHASLTKLEVLSNIQLRKARMSELADAFIALPGGFGTFDELFETLTWAQIGIHTKPIGLLNTIGYYEPLLGMVNHALKEKFIYDEHKVLLVAADEPLSLLEKLSTFEHPQNIQRWMTRTE